MRGHRLRVAAMAACVAVLSLGVTAVSPAVRAAASAPAPVVYTATDLTDTSATLNASVDPGGTPTALTFCYSTSAITISGSSCKVTSGSVAYATAEQSPSTSTTSLVFSASVSGLSAGTRYYVAAGAAQTAGSTTWSPTTSFTTVTGGPFTCTPDFYQVNGDYLWRFDALDGTYVKVNSTPQATALNGIGYDDQDNYIYGVGGSTLYQVDSNGNETSLGSPAHIANIGGDFIPGTSFLLTENASGGFYLEDVTSASPASAAKPDSVILGTTSGSATYTPYDLSLQQVGDDYVGYGLSMTSGSSPATGTLYKVVIPVAVITANDNSNLWSGLTNGTIANALTVTSLGGITFPTGDRPTNTDTFGASYSDAEGDAYFYANTLKELFMAPAADLATGTPFGLTAMAAGAGLAVGANDGASCQGSTNPFSAPVPVDDSYTVVAGHALTVDTASSPSLLANDQILSGASVTLGTTILEPGGAHVSTTFSAGTTSGTLTGAHGTLDVTDAAEGYFTFTPDATFTGPETFTYDLVETSPYAWTSATSATVTINVVQQQVVSWTTPTAVTTAQLSSTPDPATDLGGAPITYSVVTSSTNSAGCSVDPTSGAITYVGAGVCTLQASAAATTSYSPGATQVTFTVSPLAIPTLSWSPSPTTLTTAQSGTTLAGAPVTDSDGAVSYAVAATDDTAGCTVAPSGASVTLDFTATTAAQCSVTVSTAATATYSADSVTVTFTILASPTFTWAPSPTTLTSGASPTTVTAASTDSDGAVTYAVASSGDTAGCSLASPTAPVVLSFTSEGVCTVTADLAATTSFTAAGPLSQQFVVTGSTPLPQTITFTSTPVSPVVGGTYTPAATGGSSGNPVTFAIDPSSTSGCTLAAGVVTFAAPSGTCVIDADQAGDASFDPAAQVQQTVDVASAPQTISFTSTPVSPVVGGTYTPTATGGGSGNPVTFSIDLLSLGCSYDALDGTVTFSLPGACVIDADQAGNSSYAAATQVAQTVDVLEPGQTAQTITFTSTPVSSVVGGTYTPTATGGASGQPVTFAIDPSSTSGCTIAGGVVTFTAPAGTCVIDADQAGNTAYAPALQVQQDISVVEPGQTAQTITFTSTPVSPAVGGTYTPRATGGGSGNPVTFAIDPSSTSGCALAGGVVTFTAPAGTCVIDADQAGDSSYAAAAQVTQVVTVAKLAQAITFTDLTTTQPVVGTKWTPRATGGRSGNPVTFAVGASSTSGCTIAAGLMHFTAPTGTCVVIATQVGNATYNAASLQVVLHVVTTTSSPTPIGYRLAARDGGVFAFGGAPFLGSLVSEHVTPTAPIVGMTSTPDGKGYWLVGSDGNVYAFGDATLHGTIPGAHLTLVSPIVGIASSADGKGYWLVAADGGVFACGDAGFYGNTYTLGIEHDLDGPVVGMAPTPDGHGYWLVASDGGVFAFGDAAFRGNTYTLGIEHQLVAPMVGMASTPDGRGYWLVAGDGGVFAFGDAAFRGNTYTLGIEHDLHSPMMGIAATPDGGGYWLVAGDGGVFAFGDAPFDGSLPSIHVFPAAPVNAEAPGT
jgi:hypothetical protein